MAAFELRKSYVMNYDSIHEANIKRTQKKAKLNMNIIKEFIQNIILSIVNNRLEKNYEVNTV